MIYTQLLRAFNSSIIRLLKLLPRSEKQKLQTVLCLMILTSGFDAIGIVSLLPLVSLMANEQLVYEIKAIAYIYAYFEYSDPQEFIFDFSIIFILFLSMSLSIKSLTIYWQIRFSMTCEQAVSKILLEYYINQPYLWFSERHNAEFSQLVLSETAAALHGGIVPALNALANGAIVLALLVMMLSIDYQVAIAGILILGAFYLIIFIFSKSILNRVGKIRLNNNKRRFEIVTQAFLAIKDIKIAGTEPQIMNLFNSAASKYASSQGTVHVIAILPRYLLEGLVFGGVILTCLILIQNDFVSFEQLIPSVALYLFTAYRMLPSCQQLYAGVSQLRFATPSIDKLINELNELSRDYDTDLGKRLLEEQSPDIKITFKEQIELKNIRFRYPNTEEYALRELNLCIEKGSYIGVIGTSGSGKSTFIDLLSGIVPPADGEIFIDNCRLDDINIKRWQKLVGYVPQHVTLLNDSVAANIAFSFQLTDDQLGEVFRIGEKLGIHSFVGEHPSDYLKSIGEGGFKLSGGQRQRIGVARALFRNPQLLLLDEITSALDPITQDDFINRIVADRGDLTVVSVSHRIETLKDCDTIVEFDRGRIVSSGDYSDMATRGPLSNT